jgi:hypothetical protein
MNKDTKILQMPLRAETIKDGGTEQSRDVLATVLSGLRAEFDILSAQLAREYGKASQVVLRAEQISNAVQRLEWALARENSGPSVS